MRCIIRFLLGRGRYTMVRHFATGIIIAAWLMAAPASAQGPVSCEEERGSLRWLVQQYGSQRTQLEFALATSEARRQAAEAEIARLTKDLESARAGTTNRAN